jgi:putative oxidoreductase
MMHMIQSALTMLRGAEWMPITAARVLIGIFFCISGGAKLFVGPQFDVLEKTMVDIRTPFPRVTALFVASVECGCGAGLALGFLTPLCAAMLIGDMTVAVATVAIHTIHASGIVAWIDDFLYLPEVLYVIILAWLIFAGPGRYNIDSILA